MPHTDISEEIARLKQVREVYFYGTCVVDLVKPTSGLNAMRLLREHGLNVRFPANQTCCSQPAFNSGFRDAAGKVAESQLDIFPDPIPIVLPSASCAEMFRRHFETLFDQTKNKHKASALASRIYEWGWYFNRVLSPTLTDTGKKIKIFYHNSCHNRENPDDARELLGALKSVEILDVPHAAECCGFGGAFSIKHADLSGRMVHNKVDEIIQSGADALVSGESSCLLNMQGALQKKGSRVPCYHLADFLLQRTHAI